MPASAYFVRHRRSLIMLCKARYMFDPFPSPLFRSKEGGSVAFSSSNCKARKGLKRPAPCSRGDALSCRCLSCIGCGRGPLCDYFDHCYVQLARVKTLLRHQDTSGRIISTHHVRAMLIQKADRPGDRASGATQFFERSVN